MKEYFYDRDSSWFIDKHIVIKDNNNNLLCEGKVIATKCFVKNKNLYVFPSIDNHIFFNVNSITYNVIVNENEVNSNYINFLALNKLTTCKLKSVNIRKFDQTIDIVLDNDIYHLDKYVDKLVYALNNIGIRTDGSCNGHYKNALWISCVFDKLEQVIKLRKMLCDHFNNDFYLCSQKSRLQTSYNNLALSIVSYHKGKSAYKAAERLVIYLNNYFD